VRGGPKRRQRRCAYPDPHPREDGERRCDLYRIGHEPLAARHQWSSAMPTRPMNRIAVMTLVIDKFVPLVPHEIADARAGPTSTRRRR